MRSGIRETVDSREGRAELVGNEKWTQESYLIENGWRDKTVIGILKLWML